MKKFSLIMLFALLLVFNLNLLVHSVQAESAQDIAMGGLAETAKETGLEEGNPATTVGAVLGVLLSILGLILLIVIIYGGILWMTAGGEEASVKKGRSMIIEGVIGLAICLLAYALTTYVVAKLTGAMGGGAPEVP